MSNNVAHQENYRTPECETSIQLVEDTPPLIPPGEYEASYTHHEVGTAFKQSKVYVWMQIIRGEYTGIQLYRAYRVESFKRPRGKDGKKRKGGSIKLRHSSELFRQWVKLTGEKERPDRIDLRRLKGCSVRIRVRTVTHDYDHKPLPRALQYSVIDQLISVEAGKM